ELWINCRHRGPSLLASHTSPAPKAATQSISMSSPAPASRCLGACKAWKGASSNWHRTSGKILRVHVNELRRWQQRGDVPERALVLDRTRGEDEPAHCGAIE